MSGTLKRRLAAVALAVLLAGGVTGCSHDDHGFAICLALRTLADASNREADAIYELARVTEGRERFREPWVENFDWRRYEAAMCEATNAADVEHVIANVNDIVIVDDDDEGDDDEGAQ